MSEEFRFDVQFFNQGDSFIINYTKVGGNPKNPDDRDKAGFESFGAVSDTLHDKDTRRFKERFPVLVKLVAKNKDDDVRSLHIVQDVTVRWRKRVDGEVVDDGMKPNDYSPAKWETDPHYGGWWLFDDPYTYLERDKDENQNIVWTEVFWEAHVYVKENPKIECYWGYYARADYKKKGADKDAIVERKGFGPLDKPMENPYLKKKD
jgi:hypothetical protein